MKAFDVLVVGELNIDIILDDIRGFPTIGKEILAKTLNITLGSSSAIFASNLSTLGTSVAFMGKTGNDTFSNLIKKALKHKKVDTGFILQSDEYQTGMTIVMNYEMDRANVTFPGAMEHLAEKEVTDAILMQAKHLHISSIFLQTDLIDSVGQLFQRAKKLGLSTSMDPQWDPAETWALDMDSLLPHIDVFLPNAQEFKHLTKSHDLESGLERIAPTTKVVVIKDGIHGAHLWESGNLVTKPAFLNSAVVDCIGAGDSFNAGFISEYLKGEELERCLEVGNIMGAINTTAAGGTAAFDDLERIKEISRNTFSYSL